MVVIKQDYDKLNFYLNDIFAILNKYDRFLTKNIDKIWCLNSNYIMHMKNYELSYKLKENKLTYMEVYLLAREIIESINPTYLDDYDALMESGKLDFGYEDEYDDSSFSCLHNLIDIRREFNYSDVVSLVHEFIHYTNGKNKRSNNRYLLTEFLSIYFEMYAVDYLIEKGIPIDEIGVYDRLVWTNGHSNSLYKYEMIFLAYEKFGCIDESTINYLNKYFSPISKEVFDIECQDLLQTISKAESNYRMDIMYEKKFDFYDFFCEHCSMFYRNYRYLLGTLLAFYAREYCEIEDIIYLNDHINDDNLGKLKMVDLLKRIGVDIKSSDFIAKSLEGIDNYIKKYCNEKSR